MIPRRRRGGRIDLVRPAIGAAVVGGVSLARSAILLAASAPGAGAAVGGRTPPNPTAPAVGSPTLLLSVPPTNGEAGPGGKGTCPPYLGCPIVVLVGKAEVMPTLPPIGAGIILLGVISGILVSLA
jgi:hypothetical protein